jgi:cbb3-type cytochrome oxidase cytochrome c subunit
MRYAPDEIPVERKSFSAFFFLLGALSVLTAAWVIFNEFQTRRPWKKYQSEFYRLERLRIRSEIEGLEDELRALGKDPADAEALAVQQPGLSERESDELARDLLVQAFEEDVRKFNAAWGKTVIREAGNRIVHEDQPRTFTDAFWRQELTVADLQRMYEEEDGKLRVQKSLRDAEYYRYAVNKEAESDRRRFDTAVRFRDARIVSREEAIEALTRRVNDMRAWFGEFQRRKAAASAKRQESPAVALAEKLLAKRQELRLYDYDILGYFRNFQEAKRPQIRQVLLNEVGHETNNADRCLTCHIAADQPGYDWWIAVGATTQRLPDGNIAVYPAERSATGMSTPQRPSATPIGDMHGLWLPRAPQTGRLWTQPLVFVNATRYDPVETIADADGGTRDVRMYRFRGRELQFSADFVERLTDGAVVEVYQAYPVLYRSHPHIEGILGAHPTERFGCITCHDGQGRALTWRDAGCDLRENVDSPNSPMFYWEEHVLTNAPANAGFLENARGRNIVDTARAVGLPVERVLRYEADWESERRHRRDSKFHPKVGGFPLGQFAETKCRLCHTDSLDLDFAPTLSKARRLFEGLGCQGCHFVADFDRVIYDPTVDYVEYRRRQAGPSLTWDGRLARSVNAEGGTPSRGIGWKLNETTGKQWLFNWLKDPRSYAAATRMPNYRFPDADAQALTAFLLRSTQWEEQRPTPVVRAERAGVVHLAAYTQAATDANGRDGAAPDPESVKKGEALVRNIGCLACHQIRDADGTMRGSTFGPALSRVGSKVSRKFLEQWLLNPRGYDPRTIMPSLFDRLPPPKRDEQVRAIVDYLLAQNDTSWMRWRADFPLTPELVRQGQQLFGPSGYGCVGCHFFEADVPDGQGGTQHVGGDAWAGQQIGPELSDFGSKRPEVLDFGFTRGRDIAYYGDRSALRWGEVVERTPDGALVLRVPEDEGDPSAAKGFFFKRRQELREETIAPNTPTSIVRIEHTWHDWAFNKIKEPSVYTTEVNIRDQKMPNFYLSDDEAAALLVLLKGFRGPSHVPEDYVDHPTERERRIERGRRLTRRYNCVGCHAIEESFATHDGRLITGWDFGRHVRDDAAMPIYPGPDGAYGTADDVVNNGWAVPPAPQTTIRQTSVRAGAGAQEATVSVPSPALETLNPTPGKAGFHSVGGALSSLRAGYSVATADGARTYVQHGPVLAFAGRRLRADWLVSFLKRPYPVRQYLFDKDQGRMPWFRLTDEEVSELVAYLMALADEPYPYQTIEAQPDPGLAAVGRNLYQNEARCATGACHPSGRPTADNLAPDLVSAARLKPEWIEAWLANPDTFWPGNGMPYFPWEMNGVALFPQYMQGDVQTQMRALRDYVLTLGPK